MFDEYQKEKRKHITTQRSIRDYGLGIVFLLVGAFFLFRQNWDLEINRRLSEPGLLDKMFGGLCLLYGSWRVYRGYKKNYF